VAGAMPIESLKKTALLARGIAAGIRLTRDPSRLGDVFEIADVILARNPPLLHQLVDLFALTPTGADSLARRARIGPIDVAALAALLEGTLGRAFAEHLQRNGLDPNALPTLDAQDDGSYARAHLYETHDVWHAVTGFGADVNGEVGLQAFYLGQFPSKLALFLVAGGLLNSGFFAWDQCDARMKSVVRGYLLGRKAKPLLGVDWKALWEKPLSDVQRDLGIDLASVDAIVPS
jgi:ubiquinone biosynthesis protein Coq4